MTNTILSLLQQSDSIQKYLEAIEKDSLLIEGLSPSAKACVSALTLSATKKSQLIITGAGPEELKLYNNLPCFSKSPIIELQAWETLPNEHIAPSPDIVGSRYLALQKIANAQEPVIVICTLQSCLQKVLPRKNLQQKALQLTCNQKIIFDTLISQLLELGFERKNIASDKGEFAVRGGLIDVFPVTSPEPFRLEFWGDEIESIRAYDPAGQTSTHQVASIQLTAAKELEFIESAGNTLETIFDYIGPNSLIILDDLEALEDRYASLVSLGANTSKNFLSVEELFDTIAKKQIISMTEKAIEQLTEVSNKKKQKLLKFYSLNESPHEICFEMFQREFKAKRWNHPFELPADFIAREALIDEEITGDAVLAAYHTLQPSPSIVYVTQNESEKTVLEKKLSELGIRYQSNQFIEGYLSSGLAIKDSRQIIFPMTELTHRMKVRRERQRTHYHFNPTDAFDILPGEMVVHYSHGIGKFLAIEKRPNHLGVEQEFFLIEYADKARMFVPLTQAHLITKYIGTGSEPRLHTIGAGRWKKQREITEKAILGFAADLLKMYAERELKGGFAFPSDSQETISFEEEFPYIETEDQLQAIQEVKQEMCSSKAMDRLVCGDVGYGKTEVALRAAFKAVVDGKKQVAVLVPTTVLAVQHYENFIDRMQSFGVNIRLLSRFQKQSEVRKILGELEAGNVDILIGTHRILQADIHFKNLGLVIVDEEQRFGVKAKEHLKRLKVGVDCLTLTATPIPRTLYLSMVGARSLSVISTPPQDRLPIKTIISDPDDQIIQTALLRELSRDGQAYFIHNRVESIYERASHIQKLLPKARIVIGHGQMSGDELDLVFHAFKKGDADILVATSIIENGIDIANANTILVDNADWFGIADLYQLRGRVGRWNRRAYAYFLIPKKRVLSEIARQRIEAIAQSGGFGGGMKMAMRDLQMRGAGDILGIEQSGHAADVGFHLYCKLLKRTIESMQGKASTWTMETKIEIPYDARLPEYYVNDVSLRMEMYQRFGNATALEEVDAIFIEIKDRFGRAPEPVLWLYHMARLRVFAAQRGYTLIKIDNVTMSYEKKSSTQLLTNKVLIGRIRSPAEMEAKICGLL